MSSQNTFLAVIFRNRSAPGGCHTLCCGWAFGGLFSG